MPAIPAFSLLSLTFAAGNKNDEFKTACYEQEEVACRIYYSCQSYRV